MSPICLKFINSRLFSIFLHGGKYLVLKSSLNWTHVRFGVPFPLGSCRVLCMVFHHWSASSRSMNVAQLTLSSSWQPINPKIFSICSIQYSLSQGLAPALSQKIGGFNRWNLSPISMFQGTTGPTGRVPYIRVTILPRTCSIWSMRLPPAWFPLGGGFSGNVSILPSRRSDISSSCALLPHLLFRDQRVFTIWNIHTIKLWVQHANLSSKMIPK